MLIFQIIYYILLLYITSITGLTVSLRHEISIGEGISNIQDVEDCLCVPFYLCDENNIVITDGKGVIDIRTGGPRKRCDSHNVCCKRPKEPTDTPLTSETKYAETDRIALCGVRNYNGIGNTNPTTRLMESSAGTGFSTKFGEFPWMAAVFKTDSRTYQNVFICGGSIIHRSVILTAAHCLEGMNITDLKIGAGIWDIQSISEIRPHQERYVSKAVIHPQYNKEYLYNDIALLFLISDLLVADNVGTICFPEEGIYIDSSDCIATGWGKNNTGVYQVTLKKIELPLVINSECEESLRTTHLGSEFKLDQNFLCAGGNQYGDTCQGDGGGPLACKIVGRTSYAQVGVTSWGVACGTSAPGVYASVIRTLPWIKTQLDSIQV